MAQLLIKYCRTKMNLAKAKSNFPDNSSSSQETNSKQNLFEPFQIPEVKFIFELRAVVFFLTINP